MTTDKKNRFTPMLKVLVWTVAALAGGVLGGVAVANIPPGAIPTSSPLVYTGELADGQGAIGSVQQIRVAFFDEAAGGSEQCAATLSSPALSNGRFSVDLPSSCEAALINRGEAAQPTYVEVSVTPEGGGTPVTFARSRIGAVPYAASAAYAGRSRNFMVEESFELPTSAETPLDCEWRIRAQANQTHYGDGSTLNLTRWDPLACPADRPLLGGWDWELVDEGSRIIRPVMYCCRLSTMTQ